MDRDFLLDMFASFGPVTLRRMFSGFGISVDGINFAMALRAGLILRADELTIPRFEAEGAKPFQYTTSKKTVTVASYWHVPERLYDDPDEFGEWARVALAAAQRAALKKGRKGRKTAKKALRRRR
jgi:DNA transformation protein